MSTRRDRYRPENLTRFDSPIARPVALTPHGRRLHVHLPKKADSVDTARVVVAGDWAAVREFAGVADLSPGSVYGSLHPIIAQADLSIVNLECPLGGETPIVKDGPNFRCEPSCASALTRAGFHVATLANNHIYDQGADGLSATLQVCREAGLMTVGAGADIESAMEPLFVDVQGIRLGVLSLSEVTTIDRHNGGAGPIFDVHVPDRCRQAKRHCDQLLVIVHGGKEYAPVPPPYWIQQVFAVAQVGADAIVGHHPHVPQGLTLVETRDGRSVPVVFSTGNFVFPPRCATAVMSAWMELGYLVELGFDSRGVTRLDLLPYHIQPPRGVQALNEEQTVRFGTFLQALSDPLCDPVEIERWFDDCCDYFWRHEWYDRVEGLTAKLCRDEIAGLKHGRSHFQIRAHSTLIDRVIARKLAGTFGDTPPKRLDALERWFRGDWPERVLEG
ncbi:MAG: CapA family protein [Phycisphaerae bacterium]